MIKRDSQLIRDAVKALVHKCGFHVSRINNAPFGRDLWFDIARLSECWRFPLSCVFDVGANIGSTSLDVLAHFPNAVVYSFEPHPDTFRKLAERLKGQRAQAFNIALSDKSGGAQFYTNDNHDEISSLSPSAPFSVRYRFAGKPLPILTSTIDEFCCSHGVRTIDILKVDTEGCDLDVLKGAAGKLKSHEISFVYAEFNDIFERTDWTGGALAPICAFLESFGLRFVTIHTDFVVTDGEFFAGHNALFAAAPAG
jgi:FkbM family methyltransferase